MGNKRDGEIKGSPHLQFDFHLVIHLVSELPQHKPHPRNRKAFYTKDSLCY